MRGEHPSADLLDRYFTNDVSDAETASCRTPCLRLRDLLFEGRLARHGVRWRLTRRVPCLAISKARARRC